VFDRFDRNGDGFLSSKEFDFQLDLTRTPAEGAFDALDRDGNQKLDISDVVGLQKPTTNDPTAVLRWEERTMEIEDAIRKADKDGEGALSLAEFKTEQPLVTAVMTGRPVPQSRGAMIRTISGTAAEGSWNWRMLILVMSNILLLGGVGWMVLRPRT
jgi:hypothetical protein